MTRKRLTQVSLFTSAAHAEEKKLLFLECSLMKTVSKHRFGELLPYSILKLPLQWSMNTRGFDIPSNTTRFIT